MKRGLVSIVIPTHNRRNMLSRLLRSIQKSMYNKLEIIVVDDASEDNTTKYVKKNFKNVKVIHNKKNLFTAASRNKGLKAARGEYIFFIDDDNVLDKKAISCLVGALEEDEYTGEVGPVNYNFNNKHNVLWFTTKRNMLTTKTNQPRNMTAVKNRSSWDTADIPNAFMVRSKVVKDNKILFREKFGIMYEESDFAYRIRHVGYGIKVIRAAKIYHDIERKVGKNKVKDYMYHFMTDIRRPYVIARNRILFHSLYSNKLEFISILLVWSWVFAFYYSYKMLFYSGAGYFSLVRKFSLVLSYFKGFLEGVYLSLRGSLII